MMFCENCHTAVSEDDVIIKSECLGECHGVPAWNYYDTCPHCGSDEIYEAQTCPVCGEAYGGVEDLCDNCLEYIAASFTDYIRNLQLALGTDYETTLEAIKNEIERRA